MTNLFSKMNGARITNSLKVISSYYGSRSLNKVYHMGMPMSLAFEPTTSCNLRCPQCPSGLRSFTRPTGMVDPELFEQAIDEVSSTLLYLTLYFQGEPYLHPDLFRLISYAHNRNIYVSTSTNAHFLSTESINETVASGLDRLIISIDGIDQGSYEQYREGGSLEKVLQGTRDLIKIRNQSGSTTPHIIWQMVVFSHNENQVDNLKVLAQEIGVDEVSIKTAQIYDYEGGSDLIPSNDKYSRYTRNGNGSWKIKNRMEDHCWKMWHSCVITWDGKVVPCCFDKDAANIMGDITETSLGSIWRSDKYNSFRKKVLRSRSEIEMCKNCTEGTKVHVS